MSKNEMIKLYEVRDWMKTFGLFEYYYIGKLDNKPDKSLGVYQLKSTRSPITALGGSINSSYNVKGISLLIHWNKNARECEELSDTLFEKLLDIETFNLGNWKIHFVNLLVPEPQMIDTDEKGIYESVIELELYYERRK